MAKNRYAEVGADNELVEISRRLEELKKEMRKKSEQAGKDSIRKMFGLFLEEHPEVEAVSWTQWIPGFNDGDPCVFTRGDVQVRLSAGKRDDFDDGEWMDGYDLPSAAESRALSRDMDLIDSALGSISDEVLESVFDSNVRVVVTRDSVLVEEYDCGY